MNPPNSDIPDHLKIRFWRRLKCRVSWLAAKPEERHGCIRIARRGGSFWFHSTNFLRSTVQGAYLRCLPIDDADLEAIGTFRHCEALDLGGTCISDHGIRYLSRMESLQYLFLWHTQISDAAIDWIAKIPQLRMLSVCNTSISIDGVDNLHCSLKDCLLCLDDDHYRYGQLRDLDALRSFAES
ncbi:Leucine Rich repeats (2 copies) [Rubripirellula tenax]|uniref:Leucine Rich repeats (2 copies) n=1 Tax=Rubripirellula tenax TaxID=2528015 RepID=A0A5C6EKQ7_9BACT|nr:Leucine Rich repeats (2 copies) [Rubripirellula tenax]